MRVTHIVSCTLPWTSFAMEKIAERFNCLVEIERRNQHVMIVHARLTREQLLFVIPKEHSFTLEYKDKTPAP